MREPGVFRVPVDGGEEVRVLDHGRAGVFAGFDKGICLLHTDPNGNSFVEIFNFATQRLSRVAALPKGTRIGLTPNDRSLAVSPDGRWILYVQLDRSGNDIMLMENFR